ncbi:MAG: RecQ family ATP-dependent DNA helicase [Chitinophagaceae bacterium]|nr:RecQ family ATP-dependent DNA helicase [Chitinophagaceae bacterium]MBP7107174.1 RecQ family ATP-dependent DNA helicase [Chitinophagaceae bacterium]HQX96868.1 ATP-dependent DNA helicase RecQ [Chitinophagaceae bacterium]HQZ51016.1 ATP-dependent DNA helicase RecQ [Chitinophagaceae bacterium]
MAEIHSILKQYWGYDSFRPLQEDIINAILEGNDSLALMPTGGGKSLCYQVPAMAKDGLCLVVSPLIALMKDQVENLRRKGITAFAVYSGMSRKEVINTFKVASESNCKFLYVSPERLESTLFKEYLPGLGVNLIAVDEAHCISQWGYDFRPPYLRIAALREELPHVTMLALTASATPEVQKDICEKLEFQNHQIFRQSFERANLSYSVFKVDSKINKIIEVLRKVNGTSIVYCKSRKRTKELSELLQLQQISSDYYHAGLAQEERSKRQEAWINNKTRVIVCTNAFGMGIDKPDVRTVIHADVPDCLENYYQEAGRGGRDGKTAYAVLLYDDRDIHELEKLADLRFPSLKDIRDVYQSIANYLQIPVGSGEGEYYDFDISDFLKKFKLVGHTTLYSLKSLEQENLLTFNEQVFNPSTVVFTTDKNQLRNIENENVKLDNTIKTLLRAYEGIFDQPTSISEKMMAGLLKTDYEEVKKQLQLLHKMGIIEYQPQKDTPQLFLSINRIKAEDVRIDMAAYINRKEQFQRRMKQMLEFVDESTACRSQVIGFYFGDEKIKACGICDNCLRQKASVLSKEEFETLHLRIINLIKLEPLHTKDLLLKLDGVKKEKAWKVIEFLQAENKISVNKTGLVSLN